MTQILRVASLSLPSGWQTQVEINAHPWGNKGIRDERKQCHQCHPLTLIINRNASK